MIDRNFVTLKLNCLERLLSKVKYFLVLFNFYTSKIHR